MKKNTIVNLFLVLSLVVLSLCAFSGCVDSEKKSNTPSEITINTKLYFADKSYDSLVEKKVSYKVNYEVMKYEAALNLLIAGPSESDFYPVIDKNTEVLGVDLSGGVMTVDFSESFLQYNTGGSSGEYLCLYSIVNTLCEFDEVDKVIFTVNGKKIETFGHFDMTEPYEKDLAIIK